MIDIPKNEYVQPTEVREEVVQAICEAFIKKGIDRIFHPHNGSNRGCRDATLYIAKPTRAGLQHVWRFKSSREVDSTDISYRIRGVEMKRAFEELIKAGYYMFRVWSLVRGSAMNVIRDRFTMTAIVLKKLRCFLIELIKRK